MKQEWFDNRVKSLVRGFIYEVQADETLEEIVKLAQDEWEADAVNRDPRHEAHKPSAHSLALDYLRHNRTNYDLQCEEIVRKQGAVRSDALTNAAHSIVRAENLRVIREAYPELSSVIQKKRDSAYSVVRGQRVRVGRTSW